MTSCEKRNRDLLFQTLERLREEVNPKFYDWKDADDWLFSELDFTKDELMFIYAGRNAMVNYSSAREGAIDENARTFKQCLTFISPKQIDCRVYNILYRNDLLSISKVSSLTEKEAQKLSGVGPAILTRISNLQKRLNAFLKDGEKYCFKV